jgi:N6-L-threonylcarbamoyladenine synthase
MPSLLTGLTVARTLWNILNKQIIEINHIKAHIFANFLERQEKDIKFPLVCLTVSGGHNEIYYMENMFDMQRLGGTTDDSAWEAFDKVAKMMGLWYPGWPIISKLASQYSSSPKGEVRWGLFPRVWLKKDEYDFSFSWLKSAVKREVDKRWELSLEDKKEISFEFESAVIEVLAYKLVNAWIKKRVWTVMLAWWVSANDKLISLISEKSEKEGLNFIYPVKKVYCWDNAAMVGINAYFKILNKKY